MNNNQETILKTFNSFITNFVYRNIKSNLAEDCDKSAISAIMSVRVMTQMLGSKVSYLYYSLPDYEKEELTTKMNKDVSDFVADQELIKSDKDVVLGLLFEVKGGGRKVRKRIKDLLDLVGLNSDITKELLINAEPKGWSVDIPEEKLFTSISVMRLKKISE